MEICGEGQRTWEKLQMSRRILFPNRAVTEKIWTHISVLGSLLVTEASCGVFETFPHWRRRALCRGKRPLGCGLFATTALTPYCIAEFGSRR